jgi:pyruvate dehydrogenase E1 component beta subunit
MATIAYRDAIVRALDEEMARDQRVIFFGEDVGASGGVFKVTPGLFEKYGDLRVRDTPISENAIVGAGIGAAITGLRPVIEIMFADFAAVCLDQIVNQAAKLRYMSGGQLKVPLTIRMPQGAGMSFGAQHSQSVEGWFMGAPGLKIAVPSNPADALGLLKTAIRDDNPVVFLEHKAQYSDRADVPDGEYVVPFGAAKVVREGRDLTIVAVQRMVAVALSAAETLAADGISCEVIDPRTLVPLDLETILRSVGKTTRLITVEEAPRRGGWGAEIVSRVADEGIWRLDAPIRRVTMGDTIIPFSPPLEAHVTPSAEQVVRAAHEVVNRST